MASIKLDNLSFIVSSTVDFIFLDDIYISITIKEPMGNSLACTYSTMDCGPFVRVNTLLSQSSKSVYNVFN